MNLTELWNYMQFDLEADKFGNEMRQSPKRKQLVKQTEQLKELQNSNARIDAEAAEMDARITELRAENDRLLKLLDELKAGLTDIENMDEETLSAKMKPLEKLVNQLESYEKELAKLHRDAENGEKRQKEVRVRAARLKSEYDSVKQEYDVEFAADKIKLKQLRDAAEKEAAKLDPADYERYKQIKQHSTPPIAKVVNNQCTGCFMTLPIGILRDIKTSGTVCTCDNCGRLLYTDEA